MADCLVVIVARGGLKMLPVVWRLWPSCEKITVNPTEPRVYASRESYRRVYIVDSTVYSGATLLHVADVVQSTVKAGEVLLAARPRSRIAREIVDIELPEPEFVGRGKLAVFVSGPPGVGKTTFAAALAYMMGAERVKWGEIVSRLGVGRYGEELARIEERQPYYTVVELYPEIERIVRRASSAIVFDGVKTVEQVVGISFSTGVEPLVLFTTASEESRRFTIQVRGMRDDVYDEERMAMLERLGLWRLAGIGVRVNLEARTLEEALSGNPRLVRVARRLLPLERFQIAGYFNPFGTKRILLHTVYRSMLKASGEPGTVLRVAERVAGELEEMGFLHRGYVARLERRYGATPPEWLSRLITYTATAFRIIDDILDENTVRWMSEEGRLVESPWVRLGIHRAVRYATTLLVASRILAEEQGRAETFHRWMRVVTEAVDRELVVEETGRMPTLEDWLVAVEREAGYRAMIAEMLGLDWRRAYLEGVLAQLRDDMAPGKGGREATEVKLRRPIAPLVMRPSQAERLIEKLRRMIEEGVYREAQSLEEMRRLVKRAAEQTARA